MKKFPPVILSLVLFIIPVFSQQFLDEMELVDISKEHDVKSTIIRDPNQALLVVKTQIPNIRFQSNNLIHNVKEAEQGTYQIYLKPGTHRLIFQAEGFISSKERFYFNPKDVKGIRIRVIPAEKQKEDKNSGILVIRSQPDSAEIFINEDFYGRTPYIGKLIAGRYNLKLLKSPFLPFAQSMIIVAGETLPLNIDLNRVLGTVNITSEPAGANVYINDQNIGKTPLEYSRLERGTNKIVIRKSYYEDYKTEIEVTSENRTHARHALLVAEESQISFEGTPAKAKVILDGQQCGLLPLKNLNVRNGSHNLQVSRPGFYDHKETILIGKNSPPIFRINLKPKSKNSALLYSTLLPGSGQYYAGNKTKGITLSVLTLGSAVSGFFVYGNYLDKRDQYLKDKSAYVNNTDLGQMVSLKQAMNKSYSSADDAKQVSQVVWGVSAAIWIYNIVDSYLFFPEQSRIDVNAFETNGSYNLSLVIKF